MDKKIAIKKIVAIGPESTGKSRLCEMLASHFHTTWVPEYAREYLLTNGTHYTLDQLNDISAGQIQAEEQIVHQFINTQPQIAEKALPVFIDTDLYVMKVWSEFVFNQCNNAILNGIVNRQYDLYLLCKPDAPWVKDELREYPDFESREKLFHYYKDAMINQAVPWVEINGSYEERFNTAVKAVEKLLQ
jgi:NadR type nicotinamide-nucleotide adenylyltransferase